MTSFVSICCQQQIKLRAIVKLTPAQFRDVVGVSQETLRHWRKVLPIFKGRSGYTPIFRPGDLVAGAVIKLLKDRWGISVAAFAQQSIELGRVCNETPWASLISSALVISLDDQSCCLVPADSEHRISGIVLTVPLAPIVAQITASLLQDCDDSQQTIYFPPTEVTLQKGGKR